ncbi:MAG: DUF4829 domain-containing protein [Cellulosilyticum sp.]|nr:DUF4829 domain-containing protein [Cellulosilyticum sp.]
MKKLILCFCLIVVIFSSATYYKRYKNNTPTIEISTSTKFSQDEIQQAIDCVQTNFSFPACTLTKLWYDEAKSNELITLNSMDTENSIMIFSNFDVDGSGDNPVLTPNSTYTNYMWFLIREDTNSDWTIDHFGL